MTSGICLLTSVFCLLSAGCGFSPIYGAHGQGDNPVARELSNVYIENIPDSDGQFLRNKLIDRLYFNGRPAHPAARLAITLQSSENAMGVQKDATISRSQLVMGATYVLRDNDGRELFKGLARSLASYSKLDAQYGTLAAQRNAFERALGEISEQIVNRLSLYYAQKAENAAAPVK